MVKERSSGGWARQICKVLSVEQCKGRHVLVTITNRRAETKGKEQLCNVQKGYFVSKIKSQEIYTVKIPSSLMTRSSTSTLRFSHLR
jgi:hypothetical protein